MIYVNVPSNGLSVQFKMIQTAVYLDVFQLETENLLSHKKELIFCTEKHWPLRLSEYLVGTSIEIELMLFAQIILFSFILYLLNFNDSPAKSKSLLNRGLILQNILCQPNL